MRSMKAATTLLALLAMLTLGVPVHGEDDLGFENDLGLDGENNASFETFDDNDAFGFDEEYDDGYYGEGYGGDYLEDDYGVYAGDYDWDSDDDWFDGWYGESDDWDLF